jgi:hypothetical protein
MESTKVGLMVLGVMICIFGLAVIFSERRVDLIRGEPQTVYPNSPLGLFIFLIGLCCILGGTIGNYSPKKSVETNPSPMPSAKRVNFCPNCGEKLSGNEKFCSNCGKKLAVDEFVSAPPVPPSESLTKQQITSSTGSPFWSAAKAFASFSCFFALSYIILLSFYSRVFVDSAFFDWTAGLFLVWYVAHVSFIEYYEDMYPLLLFEGIGLSLLSVFLGFLVFIVIPFFFGFTKYKALKKKDLKPEKELFIPQKLMAVSYLKLVAYITAMFLGVCVVVPRLISYSSVPPVLLEVFVLVIATMLYFLIEDFDKNENLAALTVTAYSVFWFFTPELRTWLLMVSVCTLLVMKYHSLKLACQQKVAENS